jgi:hypothetical protein
MVLRAQSLSQLSGLGYDFFYISPGEICYDPSHDPGQNHGISPAAFWLPKATLQEAQCNGEGLAINPQPLNTVLTPGLPVGYDSSTGTVSPDNTTGETVPPDPAAVAAAKQRVADSAATPSPTASWWCANLGIGCDSGPITNFGATLLLGGLVVGILLISSKGKR